MNDKLDPIVWIDDEYNVTIDDKAVWSFDSIIAQMVIEAMRVLRDHPKYTLMELFTMSNEPAKKEDIEEWVTSAWQRNCDTISAGFTRYLEDEEMYYDARRVDLLKEPFELLRQVFDRLWT